MKPFYFVIQSSIISRIPSFPVMPWDFTIFSDTNTRTYEDQLTKIENYIIENELIPIVFCSINVANYIQKNLVKLRTGIFLPQSPYTNGILDWNQYSSVIPKKYLLNSDGIIFTFSKIIENKEIIHNLFGNNIFIRPISPWKPFTGFDTNKNDLEYDINSYRSLSSVSPHELCLITTAHDIQNPEYRFWMVEGNVATYAPYNMKMSQTLLDISPPEEMISMVEEISNILIEYDHSFVIDMCMASSGPKMVEINGFSTSGWYHGMNIDHLCQGAISQYTFG